LSFPVGRIPITSLLHNQSLSVDSEESAVQPNKAANTMTVRTNTDVVKAFTEAMTHEDVESRPIR
jgi:hypothetical protein